tara:strand:- start:705 stop:1433 length:729 start_codon:yes stop_codon:yes gene_type:complete
MKSPLISVIIPSYNRLEYMLRAIESVLNQTYKNLEIIIVNDGSTEEGYLNHKYLNKVEQINLKENQKNIHGFGPGNIRNFGIEVANGKWLAFLDDDDYWLNEKIETQIKQLEESKLLMCSSDALIGEGIFNEKKSYQSFLNDYYYKKNKRLIYRNYFVNRFRKLNYPNKFNREYLTTFNPVITSSVIVEKNLVKELNGFRNLPYSADYDLWKAILQFSDCLFINKPLLYYDNSHGYGREYNK